MTRSSAWFKPGKLIEELYFDSDKGKSKKLHVILRYPKMSDVDHAMKFFNSVISETEFLRLDKKVTREEESKWIREAIHGMRKAKKIVIFAEINGSISGSGNVDRGEGAASHTGTLGISLRDRYTNKGIGSRMIQLLMNESLKSVLRS